MAGAKPFPKWRSWQLDGKLLRFDRQTGINQLFTGEQTAHFRQRAPRFMHIAHTNDCNKDCGYCYRPQGAENRWTGDQVLELARWAADWGVLEFTFGGGEPLVFEDFDRLLAAIWNETPICPSFTTNGLLLDGAWLQRIAGCYGQIQLSVYEEDEPIEKIALLQREGVRFGLNYLVTPKRLRTLEVDIYRWATSGVRDVLLLSYKGEQEALHLSPSECRQLERSINKLHERFGERVMLKVDNCWARRLARVPQLFFTDDCGAADSFVSISSDRRVQPCSFHHCSVAFDDDFEKIKEIYRQYRGSKPAARRAGCARRKHFGLRGFRGVTLPEPEPQQQSLQ